MESKNKKILAILPVSIGGRLTTNSLIDGFRQNGCQVTVYDELFENNLQEVLKDTFEYIAGYDFSGLKIKVDNKLNIPSINYFSDDIRSNTSGKYWKEYLLYLSSRNADANVLPLKLFKQRWYVLGHFHRDATEEKPESDYFGVFSFDRILNLKRADVKFKIDPDFDAQEYFDECYGVLVGDDTRLERIVIRVYGYERYYFMRPTIDFSAHLLSLGNQVKVLTPQWLADEIHEMHLEAAAMYESEDNGMQ